MNLKECILIENECYKYGDKIVGNPKGIVVHSTGANNPNLKRYIQPLKNQNNYLTIFFICCCHFVSITSDYICPWR